MNRRKHTSRMTKIAIGVIGGVKINVADVVAEDE